MTDKPRIKHNPLNAIEEMMQSPAPAQSAPAPVEKKTIEKQKQATVTPERQVNDSQQAKQDVGIIFSTESLQILDKSPTQTLIMHPEMSEWLIDKGREISKVLGKKDANRSSLSRYAIYKIMKDGIDHEDFKSFVERDPLSRRKN